MRCNKWMKPRRWRELCEVHNWCARWIAGRAGIAAGLCRLVGCFESSKVQIGGWVAVPEPDTSIDEVGSVADRLRPARLKPQAFDDETSAKHPVIVPS